MHVTHVYIFDDRMTRVRDKRKNKDSRQGCPGERNPFLICQYYENYFLKHQLRIYPNVENSVMQERKCCRDSKKLYCRNRSLSPLNARQKCTFSKYLLFSPYFRDPCPRFHLLSPIQPFLDMRLRVCLQLSLKSLVIEIKVKATWISSSEFVTSFISHY